MSPRLLRTFTLRDSSLPEKSREHLLRALGPATLVKAGTDLVSQGSRPDRCTMILSGWACRYATMPDGRNQTLAMHIAGDFVDLHSFPVRVMDHGVRTLTECSVATMAHSHVLRTETDPHLTRLMWLHTLIDAAILGQWLLCSTQRSSLEHAAHLLCELFTKLQIVGLAVPGKAFELPVSQEDFANALGISTVHVSRTFTELRLRKIFRWRSGMAEILDWEALRDLAQFDPTYLLLTDEPR